jgi:hypothetical protein
MNRSLAAVLGLAMAGLVHPAAGQTPVPARAPLTGTTQTQARSRLADEFYIPGYYEPKADGGYSWKEGFWAPRKKDWRWIPTGWVRRGEAWTFRKGFWVTTRSRESLGGAVGPVADVRSLAEIRPAPGGYAVPIGGAIAPVNTGELVSTYRPDLPPGTQFREAATLAPASTSYVDSPARLAPTYYIGNALPGTSYPSFATQPAGIPGQSTYIGSTLPGTSYPSLATQPTAVPGQSYYIGNALPGTSYPSLVGSGTSMGGYGYGNSAPGSSGGQIATPGNGLPSP